MDTLFYCKNLVEKHGIEGAVKKIKSLSLKNHPVIAGIQNLPFGVEVNGRDWATVKIGNCRSYPLNMTESEKEAAREKMLQLGARPSA